MHVQMPFLAVTGMLMTPLLQKKFPKFFAKWNKDGIPGILLALLVISYWLIPRAMDDALMSMPVEIFKFISWSFFVGVPIWGSCKMLYSFLYNIFFVGITILYVIFSFFYFFVLYHYGKFFI